MEGSAGPLCIGDFADRVGTVYTVSGGGTEHALTLQRAQELAPSGRTGGSFRLEFLGPEPVLPQGIYRFSGAGSEHDIFVVPIGRKPEGVQYEAIFY